MASSKTGRDVVVAALLGAEEFGFATAPLIVEGCIMMRKCHLNTCPVGIATQDPALRARFTGQPEHVINYFFFVAEEVRELMAQLGFEKMEELVGRVDLLARRQSDGRHWKASGLDLSLLLTEPRVEKNVPRRWEGKPSAGLGKILDQDIVAKCQAAITKKEPVSLSLPIKNTDRATGTFLSSRVAQRYGEEGLPEDTISSSFTGSAGQSFGAFLARGITLKLEGEANDYVGKGLSGGKLIINPPPGLQAPPEAAILLGNTALYGATRGEAYFHGVAGERFAVRNSGALAVVEGTGDHGCEYMTGGTVVVIGRTGRNFAAGMSGGLAFVLNEDGAFESRCNLAMVELEKLESPDDLRRVKRPSRSPRPPHGKPQGSRYPRELGKGVEPLREGDSRLTTSAFWPRGAHAPSARPRGPTHERSQGLRQVQARDADPPPIQGKRSAIGRNSTFPWMRKGCAPKPRDAWIVAFRSAMDPRGAL